MKKRQASAVVADAACVGMVGWEGCPADAGSVRHGKDVANAAGVGEAARVHSVFG